MQTANGYQQGNDPRKGYLLILALAVLAMLLLTISCRSVNKSQSSTVSNVVTVTDSVHVKKYDTTVTVHELNEYQTKVIELYDTITTVKDSIITRLVSRIIYTNGSQSKSEVRTGTGSDSSIRKSQSANQTEIKTSNTKRYFDWGNLLFPLMIIGVGFLVCRWLYFKILK
jgi:subtilase family serine protease